LIPLEHRPLGRADYDTTWALQRQLRDDRVAGRGADVLLTVEHDPPVLTAGRRSDEAGLRQSREALEAAGYQLRSVERGGEWTYHGPGQLVGYPIVAIRPRRLDVTAFVAGLEASMARITVRALERAGVDVEAAGIEVGRRCGYPGAWLQQGDRLAKLGAVGVHFRKFVSLHGLALNLDPEPWGFDRIVPCGLGDEVTSVRREIERAGGDVARLVTVAEAAGWLADALPEVWASATSPCASVG